MIPRTSLIIVNCEKKANLQILVFFFTYQVTTERRLYPNGGGFKVANTRRHSGGPGACGGDASACESDNLRSSVGGGESSLCYGGGGGGDGDGMLVGVQGS